MGEISFTTNQLKKLKAAYASGVLKVNMGDKEITYQDSKQLLKAIRTIEMELSKTKKQYSVVANFSKGL